MSKGQFRQAAQIALSGLRVGGTILKIYTCHILVFTAGAALGAAEAFVILCDIWGPCK